MNVFKSLLSQSLRHFPGQSPTSGKKRRPAPRQRRFESLENRSVLSATFGSAVSLGGELGDRVMDLATDNAGNTYVTGYFMGTADFDQAGTHAGNADILTSRGGTDGFVAKYAPDNSLLWVRAFGSDDVSQPTIISDTGRSLTVDGSGNVYISGEFWGKGHFGTTELVSTQYGAGFATKLTADGTFSWTKQLSSSGAARGVDTDAQGNVYAISLTGSEFTVQKFNSAGSNLWTKKITGPNANGLAVTPAGNVFVVGNFTGKVDFDPGSKAKNVTAGSNTAVFVLNLDTNGNFKWVTPFMGSGTVSASTVEVDGTGNVYVGGRYQGVVDFDPTGKVSTLGSPSGAFLTKLSSSGGLVWARGLTSSYLTTVEGLTLDSSGNVYATGGYYQSIDLNPGTPTAERTSAGSYDIYIVKLSSSGNYVWGETFGGVEDDIAYGISIDKDGKVVIGGYIRDAVDFNPDPVAENLLGASGAAREAFFLKLGQS